VFNLTGPIRSSIANLKTERRLQKIFVSAIPPVVIFPVSHAVGLSVIRTLENEDIPILALDFKEESAGHYSRHVTPLLLPELGRDPESFAQGMLELGACFEQKPVLFLVDDEELFLSLKQGSLFDQYYQLPLSPWHIVEPIVDKGQMYRNLQKKNYPIPSSWFPASMEELEHIKNELPYPCIVKPTYSTTFRQIFGVKAKRFDDYAPLKAFVAKLLTTPLDFVIQAFIPGGAESLYTYAAYSNDEGEPIASFTGRKIHQFPPDFGTCRLGESVKNPELEKLGAELLRILHYRGISLTEFKRDANGDFRLIELNPRPGDWPERLAQICGANLVLTAYKESLGQKVSPHQITRFGVKWANLAEDLYYCVRGYKQLGYPKAHRGWAGWFKDIKGLAGCAFFSWRDPLPALIRFKGMARDFYQREKSHKAADQ